MAHILLTGGSRGIGAAVCRLGARAGYAVVVNYAARQDAAEALVARIEADGGRAVAVKADVGDEGEILSLFEAADRFGRLSVLVNNAGIVDVPATLAQMSTARLERMFRINTIGAMEKRGASGLVSGLDKVQAVMRALEAEGVEFLNHGEPGVKLRRKDQP